MLEPYGYLGETYEFMLPLSRGRNIVSYYVGGHGRGTFLWYHDGQVKCAFDHSTPGARRGTDPNVVLPWMEEIGGELAQPHRVIARHNLPTTGTAAPYVGR